MKATVGRKVTLAMSVLLIAAMGIQAFISSKMLNGALEQNVAASINSRANATVKELDLLLSRTAADLTVIGAHKAIENYLTYRAFEDPDGETESVSNLDLFLARVYKAKPQYAVMQFDDADGPVLQLTNGKSTQQFEDLSAVLDIKQLAPPEEDGAQRVFHRVRIEGSRVTLLSAAPVVSSGAVEGLIWLVQSVDDRFAPMFAELAERGLVMVITDDKGSIIARSPGLDPSAASEIAQGEKAGWLTVRKDQKDLNWHLALAADKAEAFASVSKMNEETAGIFAAAIGGSALVLVIVLSIVMQRLVGRRIGAALSFAEGVADGKLDNEISDPSRDEIGQLLAMLRRMQSNLRDQIEKERREAGVNRRIREALDNVSASVMLMNAEHEVIYLNDAAAAMMRDARDGIREELPDFDPEALLDRRLGLLDHVPEARGALADGLQETHRAAFELGGHSFTLVASPVTDEQGRLLGTVLEWADRTQEVAVENEVSEIVAAALAGDLSARVDLQGKQGFLARLSGGINELMAVSERVIGDTLRVMGALARGDLSQTIDADYGGTFGQLRSDANATVGKLTEVIGEIKSASQAVQSGAEEISQGNTQLSQRTESQAANLEETSASMEELTATVQQSADNARQANDLAQAAREQAEKSGQVVGDAVDAMAAINASSKKIADIIVVIDEIAFQTNLLALNAAVEAARAGDRGRGFAVVASEVRNLAQRSATAAKEIKQLIEDSVAKVDEGSRLVGGSGRALEEIRSSVAKVTEVVAEMANASREQSAGITQVNEAVTSMDMMTQQNAALVEEIAAASETLGQQARALHVLMAFFSAGGDAGAAPGRPDLELVEQRRAG